MTTQGFVGRLLKVKISGSRTNPLSTNLVVREDGIQSVSVTRNRTPVETTSAGDDGWRTLLKEAGTRSLDLSISGVMDASEWPALHAQWDQEALYTFEVTQPAGSGGSGSDKKEVFKGFIANLNQSAEHSGAITIEMSVQSSGPVVVQDQ